MNKKTYVIVNSTEAIKIPYPYVYIKDDGSFIELNNEDKEYLEENFYPGDGNRPYVKGKYKSKTPDGKINGFLKRSKLPKGMIECNPPKIQKPWWKFW